MEKRELICIGCPLGCMIQVEMDGAEVVSVTGNTCKRGDDYARKEVTNPTRIVHIGDVIVSDVAGTGVDIIATKEIFVK